MTAKPDPATGLVIRYDYLWRDEQKAGQEQGTKTRPCAVVICLDDGKTVLLAAITHTPVSQVSSAIEIPPAVKRHLGLDEQPSWIVTHEVNIVPWDDPGIVPVRKGQWAYGFLPRKLVARIREQVLDHVKIRKLGQVDRR